ncbi:MAG: MFS transporter [Mesorhizobium sp.]|nr:MAG: MFS transporter [Mesorhizobium sp.]
MLNRPAVGLPFRLVLTMAAACGLAAASIYYNQPMLAGIAASFGTSSASVVAIPTITQAGFAVGLVLLAPLGDRFERRRLCTMLALFLALALFIAGVTQSFSTLMVASLLIGIFATLAQQIVPLAAHLAEAGSRGRVVGLVMSGLLLGVLVGRVIAGAVAQAFGWRMMFIIGSASMIAVAAAIRALLPQSPPQHLLGFRELLCSLWPIAREEPVLRHAAAVGAFAYAGFGLFWSTLAIYLSGPPFSLGPAVSGLFGLVGIVGALAAPLAGRLADRENSRAALRAGLLSLSSAFVVFAQFGGSILGLIAGVVLLDFGVQMVQVTNQSAIFGLRPDARSRINTIYMATYFVGGTLGSTAASVAWKLGQWPMVCSVGLACSLVALAIHLAAGPSQLRSRVERTSRSS